MTYTENPERDFIMADQTNRYLTWILLRKLSNPQVIPSWTGFNILSSENGGNKSYVGFLQCLDAPATELSTVNYILEQCVIIKEQLKLKSIVCVCDQALYAKAAEIKWKEAQKFEQVVLMMGPFHLLMMYLGVIGLRYRDAGLRDVAIQSEILADGSADRALNGKMYNRAVRVHKLFFEALHRILLEKFLEEQQESIKHLVDEINLSLIDLAKDINGENIDAFEDSDSFRNFVMLFIDFKEKLKGDSDLAKFWLIYLDMVELLLNTIFSLRSGSWHLYVECMRDIVPWTFAYDRFNYSRYLTAHLGEMLALEENHPFVYNEFCKGNFTIQMSDTKRFARMEADKVIETTINKDMKGRGGIIGFSTNQGCVDRWTINASYRASLRGFLHEALTVKPKNYSHPDINPARIMKDEASVQSIVDTYLLKFMNPFSTSELISVSTGMIATPKLINDTNNAYQYGAERMASFIEDRLTNDAQKGVFDAIKKLKLSTFASLNKSVHVSVKDKILTVKADRNLFGRIAIISQARNISLKEVFCYPLGPFPLALSGCIGELKKTNKAVLAKEVERGVLHVQTYPPHSCHIFDGMSLVQKARDVNSKTFGELAGNMLSQVLAITKNSSRVDVVFDVYRPVSIKNAERIRRATSSIEIRNIVPDHPIKQWNHFLSSSSNKNELIKFLVQYWQQDKCMQRVQKGSVDLYMTCGETCYRIFNGTCTLVTALECTQEEADTRMLLHAKHASSSCHSIIIHTPDTDVLVISIAFATDINAGLYIETGIKTLLESLM